MHDFLVSAAAFIVLIGVMVIVHEFGHFVLAKLCGVRVEAFSVGLGPRLFGVKYRGTDYKVCLLPLGGFVKMTGENLPGENMGAEGAEASDAPAANDPGAFTSHPRWQRILIGLAGPTANFILAFVLMVWYFGWINEVPSMQVKATTVDWVVPGSAAAEAGIQPGDIVSRFGSDRNPEWTGIYAQAMINANQNVPVEVERGGRTLDLSIHIPASAKSEDFSIVDAGLVPDYAPGPVGIAEVEGGSPAARAGFQPGDAIVSIDGHDFHNLTSVQVYLQDDKGKPVSVVLERGGKTLPAVEVRPEQMQDGWMLGFEGVRTVMRDEPMGFQRGIARSTSFCASNSFLILEVIERLFTRKVSVSQLTGPIGIAQMAGEAAQMKGWQPKFNLASEISLNLGILNLFPFPILDGGLIMLLLIESVLRHDISLAVKERVYQVAFVVLVVFFAFIIFNDVTKLGLFTRGKP